MQVQELRERLTATQVRLKELNEKRRPFALGYAAGDSKAKKAIAQLDADVATADTEATLIAMAIEEAERQAVEQQKAEAAKERADRVEKAKEIITEITSNAQEIDNLFAHLAGALQQRVNLILQLAMTKVVYSGAIKQLQRGTALISAMNHAGLGGFNGIEFITGTKRQSLVDASVVRHDLIGVKGGDDA